MVTVGAAEPLHQSILLLEVLSRTCVTGLTRASEFETQYPTDNQ